MAPLQLAFFYRMTIENECRHTQRRHRKASQSSFLLDGNGSEKCILAFLRVQNCRHSTEFVPSGGHIPCCSSTISSSQTPLDVLFDGYSHALLSAARKGIEEIDAQSKKNGNAKAFKKNIGNRH